MDRLEFDATYEVDGNTLSGVAHVFGTKTYRDGRYHSFDAQAFDKSIALGRVLAFYSHDTNKPLARPALVVRDGKLHFTMTLGGQTYAQDLRENIASGLMDKMSFGVFQGKYKDTKTPEGMLRTHTQAELYDVSPVALPAFEGTGAQLHSAVPDDRRREAAKARFRVISEGVGK